jgi:sterol desaturase/sphingolipid hydroxylase (fatty acid hydroxylase superfamily)
VDGAGSLIFQVVKRIAGPFLSIGSNFSPTSLLAALCLAVAFVAVQRRLRQRRIRLKVIARALFPRRITAHPSTRIDLSYLVFNTFIFGAIFGWALLSFQTIGHGVERMLGAAFGAPAASALPAFASRAIITVVLFLAYELGYWVHHYLCHRVALLWEFHKVHHTANVMTPLTVFRVHPVDTLLFANILAVFVGAANGAANYAMGTATPAYALSDTNVILVAFIHLYVHFQHSHLWIAFRGAAGRVFLSPAHHQVHHSNNPIHFNKNLGSCLAVWDWAFGTLHIPARTREPLRFGVAASGEDAQTVTEAYLSPLYHAAKRAMPPQAQDGAAEPAVAAEA